MANEENKIPAISLLKLRKIKTLQNKTLKITDIDDVKANTFDILLNNLKKLYLKN